MSGLLQSSVPYGAPLYWPSVTSFVLGALAALALGGLAWAAVALRRRLVQSERARRLAADELNRRLSELFSLQELSYVLSESLELDRIAEQVVRYAMRFLDARGALVALATDGPDDVGTLRVAGAEGTLAPLRGQTVAADDPGLVARSVGNDRLELVDGAASGPTLLMGTLGADTAAAVPLRAHGVAVGSLVVTEPRAGVFPAEDVRLLSTVATHTAIVLANARFFDMVRRAKEQWEIAFDALSEGIAVVDENGRIRRANRALAALLGASVATIIGQELGPALVGSAGGLAELLAAARRDERPLPLVVRSSRMGRTLRVNCAGIPSATREQSVVVLIEDVTDQQVMEAHLIQSENSPPSGSSCPAWRTS